jgi:hypothetical protein
MLRSLGLNQAEIYGSTNFVTTLALGLWPRQRAWKGEGQKWNPIVTFALMGVWEMWRNELTHSQVGSHFGSWSFNGLLNLLRVIWEVKTHWIKELFIPLEIF